MGWKEGKRERARVRVYSFCKPTKTCNRAAVGAAQQTQLPEGRSAGGGRGGRELSDRRPGAHRWREGRVGLGAGSLGRRCRCLCSGQRTGMFK